MATEIPRALLALRYEEAAQAYLRSLPLEHFMEATAQATQRKITMESLDLVHARRPDVQVFNELLVQYPLRRGRRFGQVVPDNMVIVSAEPSRADTSYNVPLEPVPPYWTLEYVSKHNKRKAYEDSFQKYERDLKVPYYLVFYPDAQELTLYRHNGRRYVSVKANEHGRHALPQLDLEVALLDGWVRFWYKGRLLPLPAELDRELSIAKRRARMEKRRADQEQRRADEQQRRAEELERRLQEEQGARRAVEQELARLRERLPQE
jgi:Uma2 family endonuclease